MLGNWVEWVVGEAQHASFNLSNSPLHCRSCPKAAERIWWSSAICLCHGETWGTRSPKFYLSLRKEVDHSTQRNWVGFLRLILPNLKMVWQSDLLGLLKSTFPQKIFRPGLSVPLFSIRFWIWDYGNTGNTCWRRGRNLFLTLRIPVSPSSKACPRLVAWDIWSKGVWGGKGSGRLVQVCY